MDIIGLWGLIGVGDTWTRVGKGLENGEEVGGGIGIEYIGNSMSKYGVGGKKKGGVKIEE